MAEALGEARRPLDEAEIDVPFWDAAQRLARLLSTAFKKQPWPLEPIMTLDHDSFVALISADAKVALARRLIAANEIKLRPWQQEALAEVIASRADHDGLRDALISLFSRVKPF